MRIAHFLSKNCDFTAAFSFLTAQKREENLSIFHKRRRRFCRFQKKNYLCNRFGTMGPNGGMVDTRDLKSLGHCGCTSSSLVSGTAIKADHHNDGQPFLYVISISTAAFTPPLDAMASLPPIHMMTSILTRRFTIRDPVQAVVAGQGLLLMYYFSSFSTSNQ